MTKHLLIVDDDRQMVATLCDVAELAGWRCDGAYTGGEALAAIRWKDYDTIVMDIRMPGMNGIAALKAIRAERPAARIILMTAVTAPEILQEAEQEGAVRVLPKPVDPALLLELL